MRWFKPKRRCQFGGHKLNGPEHTGTILCSRCGEAFDADLLRELDKVLAEQGQPTLLPPEGKR